MCDCLKSRDGKHGGDLTSWYNSNNGKYCDKLIVNADANVIEKCNEKKEKQSSSKKAKTKTKISNDEYDLKKDLSKFKFPTLDLLTNHGSRDVRVDEGELLHGTWKVKYPDIPGWQTESEVTIKKSGTYYQKGTLTISSASISYRGSFTESGIWSLREGVMSKGSNYFDLDHIEDPNDVGDLVEEYIIERVEENYIEEYIIEKTSANKLTMRSPMGELYEFEKIH